MIGGKSIAMLKSVVRLVCMMRHLEKFAASIIAESMLVVKNALQNVALLRSYVRSDLNENT
jgi:hypothetical protein